MKQNSISWSELAQLTHATQVEQFKWCACEDLDDREEAPYPDCPAIVSKIRTYRVHVTYECWHTVEADSLAQAIEQVKDQVAEENGEEMSQYATYDLEQGMDRR